MNSETSSKMGGDEVESLRFADRYALECIVSRGLGSVVWRARDERTGGAVALKFFPAQFVATTTDLIALQQVIAAARRLDLPNVAATHAIELHQGHAALVRPWIDGRSLSELQLTRDSRYFDVEVIAPWMGSLAEALARLHSHHLIHGALQPGKLIIDSAGDLRVIDVGVSAWLLGAMQHHGGKVESSGSLPYFSPGRRVGDALAPADDIHAFGAIVYELLTGKPARTAFRTRMARSRKLGSAPIPEEWEAVVQECLEKDPSRRIQNFEQVLGRLAPWLSNQQSLRSHASHAHGPPGPPGIGLEFQPSSVRGRPLEAECATLLPEPADSAPDAGARFLRTLSTLTLAAVIAIGGWLAFHFVRVAPRDEPADIGSRAGFTSRSTPGPQFPDNEPMDREPPRDRGEEALLGNETTAESSAEPITTSDENSNASMWHEPQLTDALPVAPVDYEAPTASAKLSDDPWASAADPANAEISKAPPVGESGEIATPSEFAAEIEVADEAGMDGEEPRAENQGTPEVVVQSPVIVTDDSEWTGAADLPSSEGALLPERDYAGSPVEAESRTTRTVSQERFPEGIKLEALGLELPVVPPLVETPNPPGVPSVKESGAEAAESVASDKEVAAVGKTRSAASEVKVSNSNTVGSGPPLDLKASTESTTASPETEIESIGVGATPQENQRSESAAQESTKTVPDEQTAPAGPEPTTEVVEAPKPSPSVSPWQPPRPTEPLIDYDQIFGLDSVDAYPELLEQTDPEIPRRLQRIARDARIEVEVVIDRMGRISSAVVREASNRRLIEPSLDAVRSWRFRPARKDGRPVAVRTVLPLVFANGG